MPAGDAGLERQTLSEQVRERLTAAHLRIDDVLPDRDTAPFHEILDHTQQLTDLIDQLCAQMAAQQAVVDAAREVVASSPSWGWIRENGGVMPGTERLNMTVTLGPFAQLSAALDKAQAAQPEGEQAR